MPLDFPASPITGATYTGPNGVIWVYDGAKWVNGTQIGTAYAPISSPVFTGNPTAPNPPVGDADTSVATTAFVSAAVAPVLNNVGRNYIHNPLFNIWQRGAGGFITNGYTADRFLLGFSGTAPTSLRQTLGMGEISGEEAAVYSSRTTFTGTAGAGDYTILMHRIEGVRRLANKTVTLSFWALSEGSPKNFGANLYQVFGGGGSPSTTVQLNGTSVTLTTGWVRYSMTFVLPSVVGKTLGANGDDHVQLSFWYTAGSSYAAASGNVGTQSGTIQLWGVQLEVGSVATPLEKPDPRYDLANCQRFACILNMGMQVAGAVTGGYQHPFPVQMRAAPTATNISPGTVSSAVFGSDGPQDNRSVFFQINSTGSGGYILGRTTLYSADL